MNRRSPEHEHEHEHEHTRRSLSSIAIVLLVLASIAIADHFTPTTRDAESRHTASVLSASMRGNDVACESQPSGAICPVSIALGGTLGTGATGVVPGDSLARPVTITNDGRTDLSSVTLRATPSHATSLRLRVQACNEPWTETQPKTYSCPTPSTVVADRAIATNNADLGRLASFERGGVDHLLFTITLPAAAGLDESGVSTDVLYEFTATQSTANGHGNNGKSK